MNFVIFGFIMPKIQSINFPDDLHRDLTKRVKETPGGKFSPFVVAIIKRGLAAIERENPSNNIQKSQSMTG